MIINIHEHLWGSKELESYDIVEATELYGFDITCISKVELPGARFPSNPTRDECRQNNVDVKKLIEKHPDKFIGFCLNTKQNLISSTYILDSPDPTWEDQALGDLHRQMAEMFELRERYKNLEYRLQLIQNTVEVLTDLSQNRRMFVLELWIVILIAVEVVLFVYDIWF